MPTLSTAELTQMQTDAQGVILDQTCTIQRRSIASDGMGHSSESWPAVHSNVACHLALPTGSYMQNLADRLSELTTWVVSFPVGTDVLIGDRLIVGSDTLTVQAVYNPQSFQILLTVEASEIKVK